MKTEEKINSLFETLRAEKASTTVSEVSTWIGVASAATAVGTSLPFLLKLKGLFISKLGIMTITTLATTLSVVGVMYFSTSTDLKETSTQENKKQERSFVKLEKQDEQKDEIQQTVFPVKKEETTHSIFPEKEEFFPFKEEDLPKLEARKNLPTIAFAFKTEGSFTKINARGGFEIEVVKGSGSSYEVIGNEEEVNSVKISISGNTIYISPAKKNTRNLNPTIKLTMSQLNGIDLSGACEVRSDDTFPGENFELETSGASTIKIGLSVDKLTANISGASDIKFFGDAKSVDLECSGASELDWESFKITDAEVNCSGASEITMNVSNSLNGTLSGASDFEYVTKPQEFNLKSSGASNIHKK
jgi:hypothetical protein